MMKYHGGDNAKIGEIFHYVSYANYRGHLKVTLHRVSRVTAIRL